MCASYGAASEFNLLHKTYKVELPPIHFVPKQIIYPHTPAPVIVQEHQERKLHLMSYSLVPSWSKVRKPQFATYNARVEEVLNKPSWKKPFESRHCLVPIREFYEAAYTGTFAGNWISIKSHDHELLTAAGIWDTWQDQQTGEVVDSFAIITTEPTPEILTAGHDRSPLFLKADAFDEWLQDKKSGAEWVKFLKTQRDFRKLHFESREKLKGYTGQMNLFDDSDE
ncbi:SOS response-associated peptidase [Bdellovibrio sp. KM01]|uniref:SOS response-associated peptidase n=1 Tax=Bdellovibrio sp. KM01 TaxID=2748865 RepID=UPI0015E8F212|nr:SOS response-associated peptidase family protein [Bdellovibrio sp. KM01]QLY24124.1 SOS response-associated peptidase [Bdellovibrio sp. KM01]